jgi:hypothetical protein
MLLAVCLSARTTLLCKRRANDSHAPQSLPAAAGQPSLILFSLGVNMLLVTRKDQRVQNFIRHGRDLGDHAELVFGRHVYCTLLNEPLVPENQIFLLRPAKPRELPASHAGIFTGSQRESFDTLLGLARYEFPHLIADFRICADHEQEGECFLVDSFGQRTASRPSDYFRCYSASTFRRRCLTLGCGGWRGSDDTLPDFYAYCT